MQAPLGEHHELRGKQALLEAPGDEFHQPDGLPAVLLVVVLFREVHRNHILAVHLAPVVALPVREGRIDGRLTLLLHLLPRGLRRGSGLRLLLLPFGRLIDGLRLRGERGHHVQRVNEPAPVGGTVVTSVSAVVLIIPFAILPGHPGAPELRDAAFDPRPLVSADVRVRQKGLQVGDIRLGLDIRSRLLSVVLLPAGSGGGFHRSVPFHEELLPDLVPDVPEPLRGSTTLLHRTGGVPEDLKVRLLLFPAALEGDVVRDGGVLVDDKGHRLRGSAGRCPDVPHVHERRGQLGLAHRTRLGFVLLEHDIKPGDDEHHQQKDQYQKQHLHGRKGLA